MESTLTTQELLQKYPRWSYIRTDRNGTRYFHDCTCGRCGGRGGWEGWPGFTCYECGGSGRGNGEDIKVYTPEHAAKLQAQREARAQKAQKEREAKAIAERGSNLIKAGFGKEGEVYVIYRVVGNTYSIKDELKALGCKFNYTVGWFFSKQLDNYTCQRLEEKDVLTDSIYVEWKTPKDVESLLIENQHKEDDLSEWQGEIGERLDLYLHIDRKFESEYTFAKGMWGTTTNYMYLMSDKDDNKYKWSTGKSYEEDSNVHFKATVKEHTEYKGVKQTVLTRCTLVKE